jgi:hypothetical protein
VAQDIGHDRGQAGSSGGTRVAIGFRAMAFPSLFAGLRIGGVLAIGEIRLDLNRGKADMREA